MATITQTGYEFVYRQRVPGSIPIVETWGIERVAAYMFLIEFYRVRSQRYVGKFTFVAKVGNIQYELEGFDRETNRDVDKLTKLLLPYTTDDLCVMWYTSFGKALDMAERMIKDKITSLEEPYDVFGQTVVPPKVMTRPTKEEYEAREAEERRRIEEENKVPAGMLRVWFEHWGVITCKIVRETACWYWVDGYSDGMVVVSNARVKKGTGRIVSDPNQGGV